MFSLSSATIALTIAGLVSCHPTPHAATNFELAQREHFQTVARRSLAGCQGQLTKRGGVHQRSADRRKVFAESIRTSRGIHLDAPYFRKRDLETVLATSHASNVTGMTNNTDSSEFFTDSLCVLGPEVTQGPYFVEGEYVRYDIREEQEGVDLYLDVEIIDVNTCEPVSDVFLEFWHANSTGVYSGVVAGGNGDSSDETNLDTTFLRGFQQTNSSGVVQTLTTFPGHYTGRAPHIHVTAFTPNGTQFDNGTYVSETVSHVGQLFFDQDMISAVDEFEPYSSNTQELTTNADDSILGTEAAVIDPMVEYVLLGESIEDGIFAWASVGIDTSAAYTISAAATLTEDGGVANPNAGGPGGGAPGGAPSGVPSGVPSGSMGPAPSSTA